jgi:hypothetical protein
MKNKTKLLALLSTPVFLGGGFAPLFLNQCGSQSSEDNSPSNYVGNDTGTDWKGYSTDTENNGIAVVEFNDEEQTASITK